MNRTIQLSHRLRTVADFVPTNSVVADVGSDHAYLPVYLIQQNKSNHVIAGEVVQGPYDSAVETVREFQLEDHIKIRLGDGLNVIEPDDHVSVITICGMGGELIARILAQGLTNQRLTGSEYLILQPNVAEHLVREWLVAHNYHILHETIVEDQKRLYEVITAKKGTHQATYTPLQIQYGVYLTEKRPPLAQKKWRLLLEKYTSLYQQIQQSNNQQVEKLLRIHTEIESLKELLAT